MPNISTLSLRELNQLIATLHGWDRHADLNQWRLEVLSAVLPALGARTGVFVATWAPEPVAWWTVDGAGKAEGGLGLPPWEGDGVIEGDENHAWRELLADPDGDGPRPPFDRFIEEGRDVTERRWDELQGGCTFHQHPDGELSWLGFFEFEGDPLVFAEQTLPLVRILEPAFLAGTEACRLGTEHGRRLTRVVDAFREPAILLNIERTETFRNRALEALVRNEPGADQIEHAFEDLRDTLVVTSEEDPDDLERTLELPRGSYRLRAGFLDPEGGMRRQWVLVRIESSAPTLPSARELAARFGLTPREAEIALGLARGSSDKALAKELGISWHTVRRHVEKTLPKLGISSRAKVMDRLLTRE